MVINKMSISLISKEIKTLSTGNRILGILDLYLKSAKNWIRQKNLNFLTKRYFFLKEQSL